MSVPVVEPLLNAVQAARAVGTSPQILRRAAKRGDVPSHRFGSGPAKFRLSEVLAVLGVLQSETK